MMNNTNIDITGHAIQRFWERFGQLYRPGNFNEDEKSRFAISKIKKIFEHARYISDDDKGILFRNRDYKADIVVKGRKIVTIMNLDRPRMERIRKAS
jgi:hypothetical protein